MLSINIKDVFTQRDNCYKPSVNTMMTRHVMRDVKSKKLTLLAKNCKNINEVIKVLKENDKEPIQPIKQDNYFYYVSIETNLPTKNTKQTPINSHFQRF